MKYNVIEDINLKLKKKRMKPLTYKQRLMLEDIINAHFPELYGLQLKRIENRKNGFKNNKVILTNNDNDNIVVYLEDSIHKDELILENKDRGLYIYLVFFVNRMYYKPLVGKLCYTNGNDSIIVNNRVPDKSYFHGELSLYKDTAYTNKDLVPILDDPDFYCRILHPLTTEESNEKSISIRINERYMNNDGFLTIQPEFKGYKSTIRPDSLIGLYRLTCDGIINEYSDEYITGRDIPAIMKLTNK